MKLDQMRRAVFLDRDGVLNELVEAEGEGRAPWRLHEVRLREHVVESAAALRAAGFCLIVVTNQPDVARGKTTREVVESINEYIRARVPFDDIRVCYHDDADACACRKPAPGMLLQAASDFHIDLTRSFMVGDRWRDIDAGRRAGCRTVLIEHPGPEPSTCSPDFRAQSLSEAARWIAGFQGARTGCAMSLKP